MKNKQIIKKMFEKEFNIKTNYREIISKIERKEKMKKIRYSLVPVCLLLTIGTIMFFNKPNNNLKTINGHNIIINNQKPKENPSKFDADIKTIKSDNILNMYSINNQINIPSDLLLTDSYCIYTKDYNDPNNKDYIILSGCSLGYSNNNKRIDINIAKGHTPLRDYQFINDDLKVSTINNVEVTIVQYKNYFHTIFNINDVYYDIETSETNINELVNLLSSIITNG